MSLHTDLRAAIIAIAEGDTTLRTLTGQTSGFVCRFGDLKNARLPAIALLIIVSVPAGGTGAPREATVQLSAVAEGNGAQTTAEAITARLRAVLTQSAFAGQNLDVVPVSDAEREEDAPAAAPTARGRADLDLTLLAHTAALT